MSEVAAPEIFQALSRREWLQNRKGAVWETEEERLEYLAAEAQQDSSNQGEGPSVQSFKPIRDELLDDGDERTTTGAAAADMGGVVAVGAQCRVLYDFEDNEDDSMLSLAEGQVVLIRQRGDEGWVLGELSDGTEGWFPSSYVSVVTPSPSPSPLPPSRRSSPTSPAPSPSHAVHSVVLSAAALLDAMDDAKREQGEGEVGGGGVVNDDAAEGQEAEGGNEEEEDALNTTITSMASSIGEAMSGYNPGDVLTIPKGSATADGTAPTQELTLELHELLGSGSFADVFKCTEQSLDVVVAAKIFQTRGRDQAQQKKLAEHEYAVVGHLTHENIIRVHGLLCTQNIVVMLQELATGGDLFDEIDFGYGLPDAKAASILRDIAAALQYIHYPVQPGLVHLDIKSENILVLPTGIAKLCDFDCAAKIGEELEEGLRGTPQFIPPEALNVNQSYWEIMSTGNGHTFFPVSTGNDIWALGILALLLATGKYPWDLASKEDDEYYDFMEGDHLTKAPWIFMPMTLLKFFSRCLDARRSHRAEATEVADMLHGDYMREDIATMRKRMSLETELEELDVKIAADVAAGKAPPSPPRKLRINSWSMITGDLKLNHSDNWIVDVSFKQHSKKVIIYAVSLVPPREIDQLNRVNAEVLFRTLRRLHNRSELQFPPPAPGKVGRPCAPFPAKKIGFVKNKSVLAGRRVDDLDSYFQAAFRTSLLADFWIEKLVEFDRDIGHVDDGADDGDDDD